MKEKFANSPPSIPSGDYKYGYKVGLDGHSMVSLKTLFKKTNLNQEENHRPENYLGAGYYEVDDKVIIKRRGGALPYAQDSS